MNGNQVMGSGKVIRKTMYSVAIISVEQVTSSAVLPNLLLLHVPQCKKPLLSSDLGWENWVIYPESFTFTQCSPCSPQPNPSEPLCPSTASTTGTSSQVMDFTHKPLPHWQSLWAVHSHAAEWLIASAGIVHHLHSRFNLVFRVCSKTMLR